MTKLVDMVDHLMKTGSPQEVLNYVLDHVEGVIDKLQFRYGETEDEMYKVTDAIENLKVKEPKKNG